ncbi:hypothetical protein BKP37_08340 [Anaerobacillus alkalilacustris]|uniref:Uncharacterized protein n=1 Tax=Anaerobacillus alkalilacustris TaxID=393763 RepID=A0A1S2LPP3_9BACI|nr:hypothetical protein BKP37_08340 [Anaerobacillus alkalilacustris]
MQWISCFLTEMHAKFYSVNFSNTIKKSIIFKDWKSKLVGGERFLPLFINNFQKIMMPSDPLIVRTLFPINVIMEVLVT